ncbi:holo-[acyl-carrier-protein] synthase [Paenibacillus faecis]|uniref:Holo-[acyl-carrier-protein] synthase n=1 Tax=Paenibacillus faecis TaxID=862114 RepID=A0A5D0CNU5_9BACL|nr:MULTISPECIES: holo-ACP synthase [Paenibacillus]MCA1296457.1 holo-ACP synthase [Paenibacillus sp. alder61]TYA11673.1 holo-[acyl-carrier-protein] synthase [Paenibacillus faecis]GIO87520.1 holo-[acyl-carrier-protein] synthase [Paenibacillus faecis]
MIYGIGHDVVEIGRLQRMLAGPAGGKLKSRILTPGELALPGCSARPAEFLSGRFAAKEAVSKAFGCGIGKVLSFGDMEILPDAGGKPAVKLSDGAWTRLGLSAAEYAVHLSITHERQLASAFAVVERLT